MSSTLRSQVAVMARRSIKRTLRQPALIVPPFIFPLILLAVNTGGLDAAADLPGFPGDSFLNFALALTFVQGAMFALSSAGTDLARDIETGFMRRLALTPMQGFALLVGQLAGALLLGVMQAVAYLSVGLAAGATLKAGAAGALVVLALSILISAGFSGLGALIALRTGSGEAVQAFFPLMFVFLFISSMALPRELIEIDWFRTLATYNPVSYLLEGIRSLFVFGWDGEALALGFGFAVLIAVSTLAAAAASLRLRLVRT